MLLGGAVSEKLVLGGRSTGSLSDFNEAVKIAKKIIAAGLSSLGVVSIDDLPGARLHRTIQQLVSRQEKWVTELLGTKIGLIEEIARLVLEKEKISGEKLRRYLSAGDRAC